jgi:WS/DGAT/MGAT family acyltransferase
MGKPAAVRGRAGAHRPALWREVVLGLAVFGVYALVTTVNGPARRAAADAHGHDIFHVEQTLHLDVEPRLNSWLLGHDVLRVAANYEYAFTYILSAFLLLGWLYVREPGVYRWARTSFVLLNLVGITVFAVYPVTPPRLLPGLGFVDTVTQGHTFGSWGSSAVDDANSLAAMPSLHLAWALWVSVVLGYIAGSLVVQGISFVHVTVTLFVIMATANHYLLDAVGGAACVVVSVCIAGWFSARPPDRHRPARVAAADAFFLHVETPAAPQLVGGLLMLETNGDPTAPTRVAVEDVVRRHLDSLPRFRQRPSTMSRWRRARWIDVPDPDLSWHVTEHDLSGPDGKPAGVDALHRYLAELQAAPMPRDRPMWRLVVVHGVTPELSAAVFLAHHVIADGFGTVAHAVALLEPEVTSLSRGSAAMPSRLVRAAAIAKGLAELATDGTPDWRATGADAPGRSFGAVNLPFEEARDLARRLGVHMTDLLLCLLAGGLARAVDPRYVEQRQMLRISVTLMVAQPGVGQEGNATGAAMIDVPLAAESETARLASIAARGRRLRGGTRAVASRFVMDAVGEVLPPVMHAWFARTVYGARHFHAIFSNMPGPVETLSLAGRHLAEAYPILPLAPGSPVAVGALTVTGRLGFGISLHPAFVRETAALEAAIVAVYDELRTPSRSPTPCRTIRPSPGRNDPAERR